MTVIDRRAARVVLVDRAGTDQIFPSEFATLLGGPAAHGVPEMGL